MITTSSFSACVPVFHSACLQHSREKQHFARIYFILKDFAFRWMLFEFFLLFRLFDRLPHKQTKNTRKKTLCRLYIVRLFVQCVRWSTLRHIWQLWEVENGQGNEKKKKRREMYTSEPANETGYRRNRNFSRNVIIKRTMQMLFFRLCVSVFFFILLDVRGACML